MHSSSNVRPKMANLRRLEESFAIVDRARRQAWAGRLDVDGTPGADQADISLVLRHAGSVLLTVPHDH